MPDRHIQTLVPTSSLVARSIDCHGDMDGLWKLLKQSFKLPMGSCLLTGPTVLESAVTSEADAKLECWVYQCLSEAYQLQPVAQALELAKVAAARPADNGGMCSRGYIFTLCTKKAILPPPKYHWMLILLQPWS